MILSIHAAAGIAAGVVTTSPMTAFVLGAISHYLLDMIPHWDYVIKMKRNPLSKEAIPDYMKVITDVSIGLVPLVFFWNSPLYFYSALAGLSGALLPDGLVYLSLIRKKGFLKAHKTFHNSIHATKKITLLSPGTFLHIITALALVYILIITA